MTDWRLLQQKNAQKNAHTNDLIDLSEDGRKPDDRSTQNLRYKNASATML